MKILIILLSLLAITACQTNPQQGSIEYDSQGKIVRETTPQMDGKIYAKLRSVEAAERSNSSYYAAQQAKYSNVTDGRDVALIDAIAALSGNKNPTNYNDALIADSAASVEKHKTWAGLGGSIINGSLIGYGINKAAGVAKAAFDSSGSKTTINADNGSTVSGAIGEGNTSTEQVSGILTDTAPVNPITLSGAAEEIASGECDLRDLIPLEPGSNVDQNGGVDTNGDLLVCSDENGNSFDNI